MGVPGEHRDQVRPQLPTYRYAVDDANRIVEVDEAWLRFARQNDAPGLDRDAVLGASLWTFISDQEMCLLYEAILERVRRGQLRVTIPFRCDSPAVRRFMELEMVPAVEGVIHLNSRLLRREEREPVPLLDRDVARSDKMLYMCSWCKRIEFSELEWVEVEAAVARLDLFGERPVPRISHGICPSCRENLYSGLKALQTEPPRWE